MSAEWYYGQGGERGGPVDLAALQNMARSGQLGRDDLVWRAGMANWAPASGVSELTPSFAAPAPTYQPPAPPQPQYQQPQRQQPQYQPPAQQQPQWGPPQAQRPYAPQQQGPYAGQPAGYGGYAQPAQTTGTATTSMVLGILGLVTFCFPLGIVALVMGLQSKNGPGRGMAIAGIILGSISIALSLLMFIGIAADM